MFARAAAQYQKDVLRRKRSGGPRRIKASTSCVIEPTFGVFPISLTDRIDRASARNPDREVLVDSAAAPWSFLGVTPTGPALGFVWIVEASMIVGFAIWVGAGAISDPFCDG
jgi:hypothetical protein